MRVRRRLVNSSSGRKQRSSQTRDTPDVLAEIRGCPRSSKKLKLGTDASAATDPQLRAHGIEQLRVADASVMPSISAANTNATVLAIAERAAGILKAQS